jgi:crotonobetainyl-CoA:carnitine CoA-transferase CaiB-like acyl-CoA transferase
VLSADEARDHPQAIERGVLRSGPERLPRLAFPARFDGERPAAGDAIPELGGRTREVLDELGISRETARAAGVGRRFRLKRWLRSFFQ